MLAPLVHSAEYRNFVPFRRRERPSGETRSSLTSLSLSLESLRERLPQVAAKIRNAVAEATRRSQQLMTHDLRQEVARRFATSASYDGGDDVFGGARRSGICVRKWVAGEARIPCGPPERHRRPGRPPTQK
jgi:hypothetical protein